MDHAARRGFIRSGLICIEVRDRRLWALLGYESFGEWLIASAPYSRAHCYAAIKTIEQDLKDIPVSNLLEMNPRNLSTVKKLSTQVRNDPDVLAWSASLTESEFWAKVNEHFPHQHIERRVESPRKLPASLWGLMDQAVSLAMEREGLASWEEGLESILAEYMASEGQDSLA